MFIFNNFSTCFGHHYAHLQENKTYVLLKMGRMMLYFTMFQLFTAYDTVNIAGLYPKSPLHFA